MKATIQCIYKNDKYLFRKLNEYYFILWLYCESIYILYIEKKSNLLL